MKRVLVTGATGFVASHLILALLEKGYEVRGTARSTSKAERLNNILSTYAGKPIEIELVPADLTKDEGWAAAMDGVHFVQHVASPFPPVQPKTAEELIIPAREGTLRVLRAAKAAGVQRTVVTSSIAAIDVGWGEEQPEVFDHNHWTRMDRIAKVPFYAQSKTLAEQAAWAYVAGEGKGMELAVINPSAVLGPVMSKDVSNSLELIIQPFKTALPAFPKMKFNIVDVRDIAKAHIAAMEIPEAAGERFIMAGEGIWFNEIGKILSTAYPERKIPTSTLPNWLVRIAALFMANLRSTIHRLDVEKAYSTQKAKDILGIEFIPAKESILASAESLIKVGGL